ncbi:MAG: phenylalanine--tRNA ligase subunit beta [Candidatus Pacearchaeota archaeon]|nr:phenylalanine--tRNA ligase subunit beta [Candidatus Pacearchaeota archaeon]
MSNIKFNKKIFEKEIGRLTDEMQMRIAMFGTPVESITNDEIEIEVFPNRPDLLSYQGFKRSFLRFLNKKTGLKQYKIYPPQKDYQITIDSSVKNIRPHTCCAIIKGLKLDDEKIKELIDLQEKLHFTLGRKRKKVAIGIYPLEEITLPIKFMALEPDKIKFQPLESSREMTGLQILQRHPTGKEYAHLLAGKTKFPIFIDANQNILSMPPIINSEKTGKVTTKTKDVFVECSGNDYKILKKSLNILITTMNEMGGKIYQMQTKGGPEKITPNMEPQKMKISTQNTNKLLGLDLNEKQIKGFLERMGHNYNKEEVQIAPWRTDVLHEVDLIEDVAIAYGYENFQEEIPSISTIGKEDKKETYKRKICETLNNIEMLETSNYHLTKIQDQFTKMGILDKNAKNYIELLDSKTEYTILRKDLTHYMLKTLSENIDSEYPQKIFEIGKIFKIQNEQIIEQENFSAAITPGNFTELKQILEYLCRMLNIELTLKEPQNTPEHFIQGRCGEIIFENNTLGFIGEIHPKILRNWKIKMPVALMELELKKIFEKLD